MTATIIKDTETTLLFDLLGLQSEGLRIGVTSAGRGEGRTSLAASMAEKLTQEMGRATMLIELDFENPTLGQRYQIASGMGLAEALQGRVTLTQVLHQPMPGLWFLPAGADLKQSVRYTSSLIRDSMPWQEINRMLGPGSVVVFDLPPLVDSALGAQLAKLATHLVMVVEANHTTQDAVNKAVARLEESSQREKLVRSVLTKVKRATPARFSK